jgi:hypothetical protein
MRHRMGRVGGSFSGLLLVAYFLKERGVAFICADTPNDVNPSRLEPDVPLNPLHRVALVSPGVGMFDNLDIESLAEKRRGSNAMSSCL